MLSTAATASIDAASMAASSLPAKCLLGVFSFPSSALLIFRLLSHSRPPTSFLVEKPFFDTMIHRKKVFHFDCKSFRIKACISYESFSICVCVYAAECCNFSIWLLLFSLLFFIVGKRMEKKEIKTH